MTSSHITLFQVPYTSEIVVEGKRASKEALQQKLGLKTADLPLVGVITNLQCHSCLLHNGRTFVFIWTLVEQI